MNNKGFVHLDIKSNNVLISFGDTVVIYDFSGINCKKKKKLPCTRLVAPFVYSPPECFSSSEKIDGASFDVWTFDLMTFHTMTQNRAICYMGKMDDYVS